MLHAFSRTHDGHAADLAFEFDACVGSSYGRGNFLLHDRKMVQAFFDEQADDTVAVEDEVCATGFVVADHAVGMVRTLVT